MKKLVTLATLVALVVFSSCNKDNQTTASEEISGTYVGTISVYVDPSSPPIETPDTRISLTASGETLTLSLVDNPFASMIDIASGITITNVSCSKSDDKYAIAGSATLRGELPGTGSPFDIPVTLSGTGTPTAMSVQINVNVDGIGEIPVSFTGARQ